MQGSRKIEVKNLGREYSNRTITVLKGIDFCALDGDFVAVMGRSGGGKSTFLRVLGLIDKPTTGTVYFEEEDTKDLWNSQLADLRRRSIGFIHQDAQLMACLTVEQNIKLPLILDKQDSKSMQNKMEELTAYFRIEDLVKKHPAELSGGEKQRVAICRALVSNPELILADEPTGNLDRQTGEEVIHELERVNKELHKTVILVTHDPKIASAAEKVVFLKDGIILDTLIRPNGETVESQELLYRFIMEKIPLL